jgi:hypothetical protein
MPIETHKVSNKEVIGTLHDVIESLIDGHEGFQKIGEHLKDETLKNTFSQNPSSVHSSAANSKLCCIRLVNMIRRKAVV